MRIIRETERNQISHAKRLSLPTPLTKRRTTSMAAFRSVSRMMRMIHHLSLFNIRRITRIDDVPRASCVKRNVAKLSTQSDSLPLPSYKGAHDTPFILNIWWITRINVASCASCVKRNAAKNCTVAILKSKCNSTIRPHFVFVHVLTCNRSYILLLLMPLLGFPITGLVSPKPSSLVPTSRRYKSTPDTRAEVYPPQAISRF